MLHEPILNPSRAKYRRKPSTLFVPPLVPTLVSVPPEGEQWEYELKYDGYRTLIVLDYGKGRAFTRNGHDWTDKYAPLVAAALRLRCKSASIDGEVIVQDSEGRSNFASLRAAIADEPQRLVFMAFDLIDLNGEDLRAESLRTRRQLLFRLIGDHDPGSPIQYSEALQGSGSELLEAACRMGLEGIVSKKLSSQYKSGRQRTWLKTKCYEEGDFVMVGAERETGKPAFALLAREGDDGLEYAGSAFLTVGGETRDRFWNVVERHGRKKPPLPIEKRKGARWVDPVLRVRAQYLKGEGKLRHATIREVLP